MQFSLRSIGFAALFLVFGSSLASAQVDASISTQTDQRGYLGGSLGISSVNQNVGNGLGFGLEGSYFINDYIGGGAFLKSANHDNGISSFFFGGEGLFRLARLVPGLQVGVLVGSGKFAAGDVKGSSAVAFGPKAAFDYRLSPQQPLTVGLDMSLLFTKPGTEQLTVFTPVASVKYWF